MAGAVLILIPKTSFYAAIGLIVIMIGALITHLMHDPIGQIIRPSVFMLLLGINLVLLRKGGNNAKEIVE